MPPAHGEDGKPTFALDPNHLHIWPRHSFMLMALPNQVRPLPARSPSFPQPRRARDLIGQILYVHPLRPNRRLCADHQPGPVRALDERPFPRRRPARGQPSTRGDVGHQPPRRPDHHQGEHTPLLPSHLGPLIEFIPQATPYHYKDRGLIIGDAAHSQVPFYGQGLNSGLEDVRVLDHFLRECEVTPTLDLDGSEKRREEDDKLSAALAKYTQTRHEDLVAICDMAMRQ